MSSVAPPVVSAARWPLPLRIALVTMVYLGAGWLGLRIAFTHGNVSPVWPATGIAIAGLLLLGTEIWPAILLGGTLTIWFTGAPAAVALAVGIGNTLEALVAVALVRRLPGGGRELARLIDVVLFTLAIAAGAAVAATVGVGALTLGGLAPAARLVELWRLWWLGDAFGGVIIGTLLLVWAEPTQAHHPARRRPIEMAGVLAALVLLSLLGFTGWFGRPTVVYPAIMWAALRFGLRGGTLAVTLVALIACWATAGAPGPLTQATLSGTMLHLQLVLLVIALLGLVLGAVTVERSMALGELRTALENRQAFFEASPLAIVAVDLSARVTGWNAAAERIFGWRAAEVLGRPLPIIPPARASEWRGLQARYARGEPVSGFETVRQRRDGSLIDVSVSAGLMRAADGTVAGTIGIVEDVSERRRTERAVRAVAEGVGGATGTAFFESLVRHLAEALDADFAVVAELYGEPDAPPERVRSLAVWADGRFAANQDAPIADTPVAEMLQSGTSATAEGVRTRFPRDPLLAALGAESWVGAPFADRAGRPLGLVAVLSRRPMRETAAGEAVLRLFAARAGAELERLRAEADRTRLATVIEQTPDVVGIATPDGRPVFVNRAGRRLFALGEGSLGDWTIADGHPPWAADLVLRTGIPTALRDGVWSGETAFLDTEGREIPVHQLILAHRGADGDVPFLATIARDLSPLKAAEAATRASEARFASVAQATGDAVYDWDVVTDQSWWGSGLTTLFGYDVAEFGADPHAWTGAIHPDDRGRIVATLTAAFDGDAAAWSGEYRFRRADGSWAQVFDRAFIIRDDEQRAVRLVGAIGDITARRDAEAALRRAEEQLRQAQKMEAVGRLAGGIAHDFNNLLTTIIGVSDIVLTELAAADPHRADVEEIRAAGQRAAVLTRQLLAFSRKQVIEPRVLDLNELVRGVSGMLVRLLGETVTLDTRLAAEPGHVSADPGQLEQVLVNLAVNARDAMPEGGALTIETADVQLGPGAGDEVAPGAYVLLAVTDTGVGIDAATLPFVFEPFFTTKEVGKGTGLGLATVYGIVRQAGGHVAVTSRPGEGATFRVYLPAAIETAAAGAAAAEAPMQGGRETVLLVEDETGVRELARRVLERQGYVVLAAADAAAATAIAAAHAGSIALLLSDVVMRGESGPRLAERLRAARPEMRVLFMSGYTDSAIVQHGVLEPGVNYLQKPFAPDALARRVREVLDGAAAGAG